MKRILLGLLLIVSHLSFSSVAAQAPAFPGAEGHGRYVTGGRGGEVRHVTTLVDDGKTNTVGTLRWAVNGSTKKIVVFDVGGIIALNRELVIGANTTIEGQTAPSPGITLRYYTVRPGANNIIRFVRFRRGEEVDVNDGADATWQRETDGIVLDHCSFSWSIDEIASYYDNQHYTMQWCTMGEALANPGHTKGEHSYGGIWGGKGASFHHNLLCHMQNRAPRFCGARYAYTGYDKTKYSSPIEAEIVDFRNCVMYNWGNGNGCYGGTGGGNINIVNNYYKAGPATVNKTRVTQISVATSDNASGSPYMGYCARYYINGNYVTAASSPQNYDWSGVIYDSGTYTIDGERYCADAQHLYGPNATYVKNSAGTDCVKIRLSEAAETGEVTTHTAQNAFEKVLAYGGASLYRDGVDARYMDEARNGTTHYTGSASKTGDGKTITHRPGIIDFVKDQGSYELESTARPEGFDTDGDGIPDAWETANGLDPNNKADGQLYTLDPKKYYTNIEVYANSLVQDIMLGGNTDAAVSVSEYYPAYKKEDGTAVEAIESAGGGEDTPDISGGVEGSIVWSMSDGTEQPAYSFSSTIGDYLQQVGVTIGSHLKVYGVQKTDFDMTAFTITDDASDNAATTENAVMFNIAPNDGYLFQPTHVSFNATRFGTDHGRFQAYWLYADGTRVEIAQDQLAQRNNATPKFTTIDEDVNGKSTAEVSSLVIHLYDIPYNTNTKTMGLANVTITGKVGTAGSDGISTQRTSLPVGTTYYNLQGMRIVEPVHGAFIRVDHLADGTTRSTKIVKL